jgi:single-strand DNA-binding protein
MLNRIEIIGNLGKDVELRYTQSGSAVALFSVATTERYKNKSGEKVEETEWHNVVAWSKLAEICGEFLHKGSKVYISGKSKTRKWQDKNGNDKYTTEIIASEMIMLDGKGKPDSQVQQGYEPPQHDAGPVPF